MNDLVEILRQEIVRQEIAASSGDLSMAGAAIWKYEPREVFIELAMPVEGRPYIDRWRERLERGAQEWPSQFDKVQLLWIGRLRKDPGPGAEGWLRLGPLVEQGLAIDVVHYVAWRQGSPAWAEWNGHGPPKIAVIEPARVRADDLFEAWRALELVAAVQANAGRAGRKKGHLSGVTKEAFILRYQDLRRELGARPTQARLAEEFFVDEATVRRFREDNDLTWPPC